MRKKKKAFITIGRGIGLGLLVLIIAILGGYLLLKGKNIAVLNPAGIIANKQLGLIIFTTLLGMVVVIPVFVMLFVFAWKYRDTNPRAQKYTPDVSGNHLLEALWWGIPIIIIGILSFVTVVSSHDLDPYKTISSDKKPIVIRVVALQWKWLFLYPEQGIATVNEVRFPEDTPVNFEITADAPMSAFWIPNLGTQTYAMDGMTSKLSLMADTTGEYRGSNTNISGEGYAKMNFKAISSTKAEFDQWASDIAGSNNHLDWTEYKKLAMPNKDKDQPVTYYMLHETRLFDMILAKYMGHSSSAAGNESATMDHEGMHH